MKKILFRGTIFHLWAQAPLVMTAPNSSMYTATETSCFLFIYATLLECNARKLCRWKLLLCIFNASPQPFCNPAKCRTIRSNLLNCNKIQSRTRAEPSSAPSIFNISIKVRRSGVTQMNTAHLCSVFDILAKNKRYCYIRLLFSLFLVTTWFIIFIFVCLK